MSIILSGLINLFRPLLSSLSGALDCEGLSPWYFLLGLRIIAIFFANGPWDKAKEDVACNWADPKQEKAQDFCMALCQNQHFLVSVSATWGMVFILCLLYVGLMRLSSPYEKKEVEKEEKKKEKGEGRENVAVVATAPHGETADISTVYTVGRRGLPRDGNGDYDNNYRDSPYHYYHPSWAHWHRHHMTPMGEGYGPIVPFGPYGTGGYSGEEYGMPGAGGYGAPGAGWYGAPGTGWYGMPGTGGYSMTSEGDNMSSERGYSSPSEEGGHVMPDDEGRSVPAGQPKGYNTAQHKMGVYPAPLPDPIKQTRAASSCDEREQYRVPTKGLPVPISSSPYKRKYKGATRCRPVIESEMDSKGNAFQSQMDDRGNMALKHRQVHRNNRPNKRPRGLGMDSHMAAQDRVVGGCGRTPGSAGPPLCCRDGAACPCAENASCHSAAHSEPPCQPCSGAESSRTKPSDSGPGTQEKAKVTITNLCGVPLFDIWVGLLLATEIGFLCVIIVLQMPTILSRSWICYPLAASCPTSVECAVRGRAEKRAALWSLAITSCLFIIACSGYFYVRACSSRGCCKCCREENRGEAATNVEPEGRVMRGDVEGGSRQPGG